MNRTFWTAFSAIIFLFLLIGREWLVHQSISSTQEQMKTELAQQIHSANTLDRIHRMQESSIAFERFIEPVLMEANRLLWPGSRSEVLASWRREIHSELDKRVHEEEARLTTAFQKELDEVRSSKTASVARLVDLLEKRETFAGEASSCRTTVQEEMKLIRDAGIKKDDETLSAVKAEGNTRLNILRTHMKRMGRRDLGEFLGSGRFTREIEQPVIELVLQIRDTEVRASAWIQFRDKVTSVLGKKNQNLAVSENTNRERIQKLFDPLAEMSAERDALNNRTAEVMVPQAAPHMDISEPIRKPDDAPSYESEPGNPASSESPSTILE